MPAPSDFVHETTTSTGTGNLTLVNVNGKRSFNTAFGTGGTNVFDYGISNRDASEWERGTGHLLDATTLVRDTVLASSNAGAAVNFSAGTKDVVNDIPAGNQLNLSITRTANTFLAGPTSGAAAAPTWRAQVSADLPIGTMLQCLQTTYTANANLSTNIPRDDTTPLSSEGTEVLSQSITPTDSTNKILCIVQVWGSGPSPASAADGAITVALFRGTTCINVASSRSDYFDGTNWVESLTCVSITHLDSPASASAQTYSVRVGTSSGTVRLNGDTTTRLYGGTSACTLTLMETAV